MTYSLLHESFDIKEELEKLGIDAEVQYSPERTENLHVVCYENLTIIFKNQNDLNLYRTVGQLEENEEIIFDIQL